jgi:hypothetical protein
MTITLRDYVAEALFESGRTLVGAGADGVGERLEGAPSERAPATGPEDLVSLAASLILVLTFCLALAFDHFYDEYKFSWRAYAWYPQLLIFAFLGVSSGFQKARARKEGKSRRHIDRLAFLQLYGIWLSGASFTLFMAHIATN